MDRPLPLFLKVLGGVSLTSPHSAGSVPARDRVLGWVGCLRAEPPEGGPRGRWAGPRPAAGGRMPVGANPGPSSHTVAPGPSCRLSLPPQGWGAADPPLGGQRQPVSSHAPVVCSLPTLLPPKD